MTADPIVACGPLCPEPAPVVVVMYDCIVERCERHARLLCDPLSIYRLPEV